VRIESASVGCEILVSDVEDATWSEDVGEWDAEEYT
jgi:hypothetical protein